MPHSNFYFLEEEFPLLHNLCQSAEYYAYTDPPAALLKLRQYGEKLTELLYRIHFLDLRQDGTFYARIQGLLNEGVITNRLAALLSHIRMDGNKGVHQMSGTTNMVMRGLESAFKLGQWFVDVYAQDEVVGLDRHTFVKPENRDARHALHELSQTLAEQEKLLETYKARLKKLSTDQETRLKTKGQQKANKIDLNEAETRVFIDEQLRAAGWEVDSENLNYWKHKTLPQKGRNMAIAEWTAGKRRADYALFIGTELYGIVEAKKYANDISTDLTQAKAYAELVRPLTDTRLLGQWRNYKVPFLFSTNGRPYLEQLKTKSGIWFLDVREERNIARPLRGWLSPEGLQTLYQRNVTAAEDKLRNSDWSYLQSEAGLSLRDYQIEAIQAVEQLLLEQPNRRRALVAMATGTGKTRTIIGLAYRLIKANRFKRILFLVDRRLLAIQAYNAFNDNKIEDLNTFGAIYELAGLQETLPGLDTRLHFATVQSMVKRLFYAQQSSDVLPVDTYDCIIVDEAHRGYLLDKEMDEEELTFKNQQDYVSQYRRVLDYFDAFGLGLTATPALHTSEIFGKPVFVYSYREAVLDGWLVDHEPPIKIKTELNEQGISWAKGERPKAHDAESNTIVELDELEDELHIEVDGFNKLVITDSFNQVVVDALVRVLDPEGEEKTLIFAARDQHADMLVSKLKKAFHDLNAGVPDDAITKITGRSDKPRELYKRFKNERYPNIVVTVDLLTTGVDIPTICNLVFLRRVKSRILYEQMIGRATRLCTDIGKEVFFIYDAVKQSELMEKVTDMKPVSVRPKASFQQLVTELDQIKSPQRTQQQVGQILAKLQRKKNYVNDQAEQEKFAFHSQGHDPETLIGVLRELGPEEARHFLPSLGSLWGYLDELRPPPGAQLYSEHQDALLAMEQDYGDYERPEDYLEQFAAFVENNQNKLAALQLICTRPAELDRASLKNLRLQLDEAGFTARELDRAWRAAKNEDIAADIIAYIRTHALGVELESPEARIQRAVKHIRQQQDWTKTQLRWLDQIEKQLLAETVLQVEDLNADPFRRDGGYTRLNKIFNNELDRIIRELNEQLYKTSA